MSKYFTMTLVLQGLTRNCFSILVFLRLTCPISSASPSPSSDDADGSADDLPIFQRTQLLQKRKWQETITDECGECDRQNREAQGENTGGMTQCLNFVQSARHRIRVLLEDHENNGQEQIDRLGYVHISPQILQEDMSDKLEKPVFAKEIRPAENARVASPSVGSGTKVLLQARHTFKWVNESRMRKSMHEARVAIVLRGQSFRSGRFSKGCDSRHWDVQLIATNSLIKMIVAPLEQMGNTVHIYALFGDGRCKLTNALQSIYGDRLVVHNTCETRDQATNMRRALELLEETNVSWAAGSNYDTILIVRHDMIWTLPINEWPTVSFNSFNFFSRCEPTQHEFAHGGPPENCVNDCFHMMQGSQLDIWNSVVGTPYCFSTEKFGSGHGCYKAVASKMSGDQKIAFVTNWVPNFGVREHSDVGYLVDET